MKPRFCGDPENVAKGRLLRWLPEAKVWEGIAITYMY